MLRRRERIIQPSESPFKRVSEELSEISFFSMLIVIALFWIGFSLREISKAIERQVQTHASTQPQ